MQKEQYSGKKTHVLLTITELYHQALLLPTSCKKSFQLLCIVVKKYFWFFSIVIIQI